MTRDRTIRVYRSNRVERLVDVLADALRTPPEGMPEDELPFFEEQVCIHSRGMESWLATELSRRLGLCARVAFPFPRNLLELAFEAGAAEATHDAPGADDDRSRLDGAAWEPARLLWSVMAELPGRLGDPGFDELARYLASNDDGVARPGDRRMLRLARRITALYDRYVTYRPAMLAEWADGGGGDDWQAALWRAIRGRLPRGSFVDRARAFLARPDDATPLPGFPPRVFLFGISMLPPIYVEVLAHLARRVEVTLLLLSPSHEYLGDLVTRREHLRALARGHRDGLPADGLREALHLDEGHPLLASLGRLGRDFHVTLEEHADYEDLDDPSGAPLFVDPLEADGRAAPSALRALQSDLLHLRRPDPASADAPPPLLEGDDSIEVHSTHGAMRQVEVLKDRLLDALERDPTLEPRDIVVMTPDLETYAPLLEAVLRHGADDGRAIPFRIADRSLRRESPVAEALLAVLAIARGRATATEVFDLLSLEPVRERFEIDADQLDQVAGWIRDAGVRWGVDEVHRAAEGQPAARQNTWRFGLDRLLLGIAWPDADLPFHDVLPSGDVEGLEAEQIGRLAEFAETLFRATRDLDRARSVDEWSTVLADLARDLLAGEDGGALERDRVLEVIGDLTDAARDAGFTAPLTLDAITDLLEEALTAAPAGAAFASGGVTVCSMVPMRAVPFRVVCLVGMDDTAFPRRDVRLDFDRIAADPRTGDRTRRDEDRYLVLEAILSARDRLILTYAGSNIQTNEATPPSVVVSELLERLDEALAVPSGEVRDRLVVEHPLAPFSPRYFDPARDPRLFSFARELVDGAARTLQPPSEALPFLSRPLPALVEDEVDLDDLVAFFQNPAKALLRRRLGLSLWSDERTFEDREPIELGGLDKWKVTDPLVQRWLDARAADADRADATPELDDAELLSRMRATGELPLGAPGEVAFDEAREKAAAFIAAATPVVTAPPLPIEVDVEVAGVRIRGAVPDVVATARDEHGAPRDLRVTHLRYSRLKAKHMLTLWVRLLVLAAQRPDVEGGRLVASDAVGVLRVPADPRGVLSELLARYRGGLRAPLPFQPEPSLAYARATRDDAPGGSRRGGGRKDPVEAARKAWRAAEDERFGRGELDDEYVRRLWGDFDPIDDDFAWPPPPAADPRIARAEVGAALRDLAAADDEPTRGAGTATEPGVPRETFGELARAILGPLLDHWTQEETS